MTTRNGVTMLDPGTLLYSDLFVPELSPDDLATATRHARTGEGRGGALFNASSMTDVHWNAASGVLAA